MSTRRVLAVLSAAAALVFLDLTIVNIALPSMQREFAGTGLASLSWVVNAYNVVFAAALLPAGQLADRIGRRPVLLGGLAGFALASALCALAPSVATLVAARVLQATAAALLLPAVQGLLLETFGAGERTRAFALLGAAAALGAATGPTVGGVLVEVADWRLVFAINVPLVAVIVVAGRRVLADRERPRDDVRPDIVGLVLLALAPGALAFALVEGNELGWTSAGVLGALAVGVTAGGLYIVHSRRAAAPAFDPAMFRAPRFAVASASIAAMSAVHLGLVLANVLFVIEVHGLSILEAGIMTAPSAGAAIIVAPLAGRIATRTSERVCAMAGGLLFASALAWLIAFAEPGSDLALSFMPAVLLFGAGSGFAFPALIAAAADELSDEAFARGGAVTQAARLLGGVLGTAVLVAFLTSGSSNGFEHGWWALLVAALLGTLGSLLLPAPRGRHAPAV